MKWAKQQLLIDSVVSDVTISPTGQPVIRSGSPYATAASGCRLVEGVPPVEVGERAGHVTRILQMQEVRRAGQDETLRVWKPVEQ
jgi:hypothetical protein